MPQIDRLGLLCPREKPGTRDKKKRQTTFNLWGYPDDNRALTLSNFKEMAKKILKESSPVYEMVVHPEMAKTLLEATEWPSGVYDSELYDSELEDY